MKLQLTVAALAGVLALALTDAGAKRGGTGRCDPPSSSMNGKYVQASSLAPHERAYKNQYGAPIPQPIVTRHPPHQKPKAQPELRSSPLPAG
jgi:hypothetical protein